MKKMTITIETGNAAFSDDPAAEVARMLIELGEKIRRNGGFPYTLRDYNGNTCGKVVWE